jgi:hypothetical protein
VLLAIATILVATGVEPFNLVLLGQAAESDPPCGIHCFIVLWRTCNLLKLSNEPKVSGIGSFPLVCARSSYVCIVGVESFRSTLVYQIETLIDSAWNCLTSTAKENEWVGCTELLFTPRGRRLSRK